MLLVVGVRLGCINHALLTKLAIESHGAQFAGWIANTIDPGMPRQKENLETLAEQLGAPPLAWCLRWPPPRHLSPSTKRPRALFIPMEAGTRKFLS